MFKVSSTFKLCGCQRYDRVESYAGRNEAGEEEFGGTIERSTGAQGGPTL